MKKIYFFSFLFFLASCNIYSQSGWFWISAKYMYPSENYNSIFFANSETGYACSYNNKLNKTTDGGLNWFVSTNGILSTFLNCVFFTSESTGYAGGLLHPYGSVYKTTDAGANWTYSILYNTNDNLDQIFFLNDYTGYVANSYDMFKTTNGGINWVQTPTPISYNMYFVNEMTGYKVSGIDGKIWKTTNGGQNWDLKLGNNAYSMYGLFFLNENTGYCVGGNFLTTCIRKTTDGGNNWTLTLISTPGTTKYLESVHFVNQSTGYAVGTRGGFFYTIDSGENWQEYYNFTYMDYNCITFTGSTGYAISEGFSGFPGIIKTTNGGNEWFVLAHGILTNINSICKSTSTTLYAAGDKGKILKSTNTGSNWRITPSYIHSKINSVFFVDSLSGFCVGVKGLFLKTTDGVNWTNKQISDNELNCIFSKPNGTLCVTGDNGSFYSSSDFGNSWIKSNTGSLNNLKTGCFIANDIGILAGENGTILKSLNSGLNWIPINSGTNNELISICFANSNMGFCVGNNNTILKSTNSGNSWFPILNTLNNSYNCVFFVNDMTGYIVGSNSVVLFTSNGGNNWSNQTSSSAYNFSSVCFVNSNTGIIVGSDNLILKTTTGGGAIVSIFTNSTYTPNSYSLSQNYPNPFNPVTKIKFDIPLAPLSFGEGLGVRLIIYDLLGREITTLVNEQLKPGTYEVDWDGTGFASGVYFYSLVTKSFVETKRMVLIK